MRRIFSLGRCSLPVQVTLVAEPVLVYPVLQVQITAYVLASCEQMAFTSQPPFFTRQASVDDIDEDESECHRVFTCAHDK